MSKSRVVLSDAASWMQVVFGGIGVIVAIVAAVVGYFAWVQPHSPDPVTPTATVAATTASTPAGSTPAASASAASAPALAGAQQVPLARLTPSAGGSNVHAAGGVLTMPCASGQSTDRQRTVEYDLAGRYTGLEAELTVGKAPDADSRVQIKIFADDREVADNTLTKGSPGRLKVLFEQTGKMRIQLTCESPDSELTIGSPTLVHA